MRPGNWSYALALAGIVAMMLCGIFAALHPVVPVPEFPVGVR